MAPEEEKDSRDQIGLNTAAVILTVKKEREFAAQDMAGHQAGDGLIRIHVGSKEKKQADGQAKK